MSRGLAVPFFVIAIWLVVIGSMAGRANRHAEQLRTDIATVQEQIAAEQARTRKLEAVVQQLLTDRAQTSASVTSAPAGPYCNLHDIQVQNPGC